MRATQATRNGDVATSQSLERLANMFAALSAINEAILRTKTSGELYRQVCEAALHGGKFVGTAIMLLEPGTALLKMAACAGDGLELLRHAEISTQTTPEGAPGISREAFVTQKPAIIDDVATDPRARNWRARALDQAIGSAAALPLIRAGRSVGVLIVALRQARTLDNEMVALLERIAENLSFALDNLDRDLERERSAKATRRLARMFAALSATNEAIMRAKTPDELYQRVCDAAVHGGKSLATVVLLAEPDSHWLKPVAGTGEIVELVKQTRFSTDPDNPFGKGVCGTAFRTQTPGVNRDILNSAQAQPWRESGPLNGVVACAAMPLIKRGQSIGVLMFFVARSWATDEEIISLLARLAENVSFALDNFEQEEDRKRAEARVQFLATHDDLTGLPNRVMFNQLLNDQIKYARRRKQQFAVMFIDLDRFKIINDTLGHGAGDLLLKEISARLQQCLRDSDIVARLSGDEFMALLRDTADNEQAGIVARRILSAVVKPVVIQGQECRVTASIGISMYPADAQDEESLAKNADAAMYFAKEEGKGNFRFFSKEIKTQSIERLMLETSLRRALENDEFVLHYQAKQDLKTGRVSGVEALLRWQHPDLGMLPPTQFIPLAEETGLIVPIGKWVLETACEQNMAWQQQGLPPTCMAVNLSPRQFASDQLLRDIDEALGKSGMPPELLELEITEGMVMQNVDRAIGLLRAIKSKGIRLAIDDFGTGYSSMSLIKQFPIDTIKVDRSFIREIAEDSDDRAITEAIIGLGKALNLTIVAEGVETKEQEDFLRAHACDETQGFLFSKPIPGDDFVEFLMQHNLAQLRSLSTAGRKRRSRVTPRKLRSA